MTNYLYSAKNNTFVAANSSLLETSSFDDAVPVDDSVFAEFFVGEKDGQHRVTGGDGHPVWEVIPPSTPEELHAIAVREAENRKTQLLAEAADVTSEWQTDLLLGIISDEDKARLIAWRGYIKKLEAVDTSSTPGIDWPYKPA
ncbi:tail fiber assembly protein [Shigella dysenteriae]|uniref:tail fiber assembly protein n=1 Tax=Escherichia coli TaxID=562 RepID=UPI000DD6811C|nr:tail fiber assembly protein [Escherichia coli]EFP6908625.1 tail fiber assembly protein [Shigella dysenteriae]EFL5716710.1 tail fiber assembly protein [Escherichia coli]EFP7034861.1 tail fiber assembly protein [Shigella dysenteriae]EFW3898129.1 tail fiber assembly protein [Shigella dysenteriae]MCX3825128.1 tail fiber assembly protein [Escherichia coli]